MADNNRLNELKNALGRASKLMQLESNGAIDKIASQKRNSIEKSLNEDVRLDAMMTTPPNQGMAPSISPNMQMNEKVPAAIRESFAKNPINIDEATMMQSMFGGGDALSQITNGLIQNNVSQQPQSVRSIINESMGEQTASASQVDYPMIRTIVEDVVRKYSSSLSKKLINESVGGSINEVNTIALGKTFKFLDSKGNIYECTMKKVGNINNKKNGRQD